MEASQLVRRWVASVRVARVKEVKRNINEGRVSRNMLTLESGRKIREVPVGMFY